MQLLAQQCSLPIGARKKILEGGTLWRKYENELNEVRKFALKFPGVGNLSRLPSGTTQLQQMKRPLIIKLWKEKYPAESGVDYDDDISVWANIPKGWWLNHDFCKYILSCFVHKDNKDISTKPTEQPPGHSSIEARGRKEKALEVERAVTKADRPVEKYGDVDHQLKKIRVEGMQSQVLKNRVQLRQMWMQLGHKSNSCRKWRASMSERWGRASKMI